MNAKFSSRIRVVADGIKNALATGGIDESKMFTVGNGTDIDRFRPMDAVEARRHLGLNESMTYLGFAGTLEKWQGVDRFLRAAQILCGCRDDLRILIVGGGPEEEFLRKLARDLGISDKCVFTGPVQHDKMPLYINCFTIAMLFKCGLDEIAASLYSSLKLRDYAACGVPILASSGAADHAIVEESRFGRLVDPENTSEVAESVTMMLDDTTMLQQMGRNGRRTAEDRFAWERIADGILAGSLNEKEISG